MPVIQRAAQRFVDSVDGVRIAVYEEGNPDGPTAVLVHGWPDSHVLWDGVVPQLAERFRVIRYDNRGVGASAVPKPVSAYTMARFADDFAAVVDACSPDQPVHAVAHDWGSVGVWEYLGRPGARDRVASFTSISGPSQHHLVDYIFSGLRRPYRPRTFLRALSQALRPTRSCPRSPSRKRSGRSRRRPTCSTACPVSRRRCCAAPRASAWSSRRQTSPATAPPGRRTKSEPTTVMTPITVNGIDHARRLPSEELHSAT